MSQAHTLTEILSIVQNETDRINSLRILVSGMREQLNAILTQPSVTALPADVQAQINSIFDVATANAQIIDEALNRSVPPATVPPVSSPVVEPTPATPVPTPAPTDVKPAEVPPVPPVATPPVTTPVEPAPTAPATNPSVPPTGV